MDIVSLIVTALVDSITAGLQLHGEQLIKYRYDALNGSIISKYKSVRIDQLEEAPTSKERQAAVEEDLRRAGAGNDDDLAHLAQNLFNIIAKFNITVPSDDAPLSPEELIERAERKAGSQAIGQITDKHLKTVLDIRARFPLQDQDLLSPIIANNSNIPESVRNEVGKLHDKIRNIIDIVATRIEERKYKFAEDAIEKMQLPYVDLQRARNLIQGDKKVHASYQALKTTVEFFADLNQMIVEKIEHIESPQSETKLLLGNAILVYELTDFVIGFIDGFTIQGTSEIHKLHEETKQEIGELRRQQKALEKDIQSSLVDASVRNQTSQDINEINRSIDVLEKEWEVYMESIMSLNGEVDKIRVRIPTLEVIRKNAKIQISLIQTLAMLQILKHNIGTMKATILTLENMRLVSLSPNRVRRLLGIT